MTADFSFEELLTEINKIDSTAPEGFTAKEMSKALGFGQSATRKRIEKLIEAGLLEFNGHKQVQRIDGRIGYAPVYKIIEK